MKVWLPVRGEDGRFVAHEIEAKIFVELCGVPGFVVHRSLCVTPWPPHEIDAWTVSHLGTGGALIQGVEGTIEIAINKAEEVLTRRALSLGTDPATAVERRAAASDQSWRKSPDGS